MAMMASGGGAAKKSTLRGVINQVTKDKLTWLENQRDVLKAHYATVLEKYEKPENQGSLKFIEEIHEALEKCPEGDNPAPGTTNDLNVFRNWIDREVDSDAMAYFGITQLVQDRIDKLVTCIKNQIKKCEYSCMYANTMTQYMDSNNEDGIKIGDEETTEERGEAMSISGNDRNKMIVEFTKRVFTTAAPEGFSKDEFEKLLNEKLFDMKDLTETNLLLRMRREVSQHCKNFPNTNCITISDLKLTIGGLLQEGSLGRDKVATLKELNENTDALTEVCTLLNKHLRNYSTWSWPAPVVVNFKRNIAGRYRAYMDEDILTAILLDYIGTKWNILFKKWFKNIYTSTTWKRGTGTEADLYYTKDSIEGFRREFHEQTFLSVLPNSMDDVASSLPIYDEEKKQEVRVRRDEWADDYDYDDDDYDEETYPWNEPRRRRAAREPKARPAELSPVQIKQQLIHIISNEIHLNNILRPDNPLTVVQTDMEWFGPSLVHEAVLTLFKFFGVTEEWLNFFKNFLQAPMKIGSSSAEVQTRKRGAPISHQLTTLFGESLLFVLDLYVNRESSLSIYRVHDDFWFWGHNTENVTKAWIAMKTFTKLAGLSLNEEKSASVVCKSDSKDDATLKIFGADPLPQRNVQWGFIVLHSDGVFRISDELLTPHVKEMREYLEKSDGVMQWIHGHNKYMRFFIRNFGEPAETLQKQHVVQILDKLRSILRQVHPATNGNAVEALKSKFPEILKRKDVMEAWIYWPVESGGLNLYNPFLDWIPIHEAYLKRCHFNPDFSSVINQDKNTWKALVQNSKERRKIRAKYVFHSKRELLEDTITDDEAYYDKYRKVEDLQKGVNVSKRRRRIGFVAQCERYRETRWAHWQSHYRGLLNKVSPTMDNWRNSLYTNQIRGELGYNETKFVDGNLVPISLISLMQGERVHKN